MKILYANTLSPDLVRSSGKSGLGGLRQKDSARLKKACQGVESLFINMMLKEMRNTVPKSGLFGDSLQKDIYTSLFDQHIAEAVSGTGHGIGIADMLFECLSTRK